MIFLNPKLTHIFYHISTLFPESASTSSRIQPRSRDDKKNSAIGDSIGNKLHKDDPMDAKNPSSSSTTAAEDIYEFKTLKDSAGESPDRKNSTDMDVDADKKR